MTHNHRLHRRRYLLQPMLPPRCGDGCCEKMLQKLPQRPHRPPTAPQTPAAPPPIDESITRPSASRKSYAFASSRTVPVCPSNNKSRLPAGGTRSDSATLAEVSSENRNVSDAAPEMSANEFPRPHRPPHCRIHRRRHPNQLNQRPQNIPRQHTQRPHRHPLRPRPRTHVPRRLRQHIIHPHPLRRSKFDRPQKLLRPRALTIRRRIHAKPRLHMYKSSVPRPPTPPPTPCASATFPTGGTRLNTPIPATKHATTNSIDAFEGRSRRITCGSTLLQQQPQIIKTSAHRQPPKKSPVSFAIASVRCPTPTSSTAPSAIKSAPTPSATLAEQDRHPLSRQPANTHTSPINSRTQTQILCASSVSSLWLIPLRGPICVCDFVSVVIAVRQCTLCPRLSPPESGDNTNTSAPPAPPHKSSPRSSQTSPSSAA